MAPKVKKITTRRRIEVKACAVDIKVVEKKSGYVPEVAVGKKHRQLFNTVDISVFIN